MASTPPPVYVHSPGAAQAPKASAAGKPLPAPPLLDSRFPKMSAGAQARAGITSGGAVPGAINLGSAGFGSAEEPPGGGAGGSASTGAASPEVDWANVYFGQYGLPSDLINQIEALGKQYGTTNPDVFMQSAQNLIRGSDWFKATYPGFAAGVTAGLFTDETGYRGYVNALNQVYQQYTGRAVGGGEVAAALSQGASPTLIGNQFQGDTIAKTNANEWQYMTGAFDTGQLSDAEKSALGREQAGIDTPLGQMVQKRVQLAMGRAQSLFGGRLAGSSLSIANGRLVSPSLGGGSTPDIAS